MLLSVFKFKDTSIIYGLKFKRIAYTCTCVTIAAVLQVNLMETVLRVPGESSGVN